MAKNRATGNLVEIHQVGKTLQDGVTGVARERQAIEDIIRSPKYLEDILIRFHGYDK